MHSTLLTLLLFAPAFAPADGAAAQEVVAEAELVWYGDVDEARRAAAASGKHVLVSFTGTGWCSWCRKLDAEVLETPVFSDLALKDFVLVRADFARDGSARTDLPFADKNNALKEALGVDGFPSIALMTPEGIAYAQYGYERGGAGKYVDRLSASYAEAVHLAAAVPQAAAKVAAAKSKEEALAAADASIQLLRDAGPHALAVPLVSLVRATLAAPDLDPAREVQAMLALSGANVVDDALIDRAFRIDPKNESGLPEAALAAAMRTLSGPSAVDPLIRRIEAMLRTMIVHDAQVAAQLYGDCAYWIKSWQMDADRSRAMASFALKLKPKDPELLSMLKDLAGQ